MKFHPDYNKLQLPALSSGIDSEGGRRPAERTSARNHVFSSIFLYMGVSAGNHQVHSANFFKFDEVSTADRASFPDHFGIKKFDFCLHLPYER